MGHRRGAHPVWATTTDGVVLSLRQHRATGPRRATLLCTHAMMASGRYLERGFAQHLAARGVEVFVLDWRGHGRSRPPDPRHDRWGFEAYVERDLPAAIAAVSARAGVPARDVCYLGHSLGGLVGLAAFATGAAPAPRRLTVWAASLWLAGRTDSWRRRAIMRACDAVSRRLGYAPVRALRLGSDDEQRGYVRQLAGWASSGRWTDVAGRDYRAALRALDVDTWAVVGDADPLSCAGDVRALVDALPAARSVRCVGVGHGDAIDADHVTLFTRRELAPLWDELVTFLCAPAGRGACHAADRPADGPVRV